MLTNVLTSKLTSLTFAHLTGSDRWEEWALNIKCKACKAHPNVGQQSMQTYGMVFVCLTSQYQHTLGARPQFHNSFWLWPPTHDDHHMGKHRGPPEVKLYKCLIPNGGASLQFLLRSSKGRKPSLAMIKPRSADRGILGPCLPRNSKHRIEAIQICTYYHSDIWCQLFTKYLVLPKYGSSVCLRVRRSARSKLGAFVGPISSSSMPIMWVAWTWEASTERRICGRSTAKSSPVSSAHSVHTLMWLNIPCGGFHKCL